MQKNKNRKIKTRLLIVAVLAFGWVLSAAPASAAAGLSIDLQIKPPITRLNPDPAGPPWPPWHGESVHKTTGNVDYYTSGSLRSNFPKLWKDSDEIYANDFVAQGAVNIPTAGKYRFDYSINGGHGNVRVYENGKSDAVCRWPNPDLGEPDSLSCYYEHDFQAGWHAIRFEFGLETWNWSDPIARLEWDKPSTSGIVWEVIPTTSLDSSNWDTTVISIPNSGKQQIDYKIAGVGTDVQAAAGQNAELEIQLPAGIKAGDILSGGARLFWRNSASTTLRVKNAATADAAINLTGTRLQTAKGATLEGITATLPDNFFANSAGNQNIYLSFQNLSADLDGDTWPDLDGGIDLVVVYKDLSKPNGVLKIQTIGEGVHHTASHPVSFDVTNMDPATLRPFFLFADAQSKTLLSEGTGLPRHNYLAMKASANKPGESELFMQGITTAAGEISDPARKRIMPRGTGEPTLASVDLWYPMFGREGAEADVLSTYGNYAPNLRYGGYVSSDHNQEGAIDQAGSPFGIPPGNSWVSFQYAASDFYGDGSAELGSNESSFFFATGLMYYDAAKLLVCPVSTTLNLGQTQQLEARYWSSYFGIPDCSTAGYTNVTNTAAWSSANASKVSVGASTGLITGVAATTTPVTISASYLSITAANAVTVTNLCSYNVCNASTNMCESAVGTIPCPSSSCSTVGQSCSSFRGNNIWEEVAP